MTLRKNIHSVGDEHAKNIGIEMARSRHTSVGAVGLGGRPGLVGGSVPSADGGWPARCPRLMPLQ